MNWLKRIFHKHLYKKIGEKKVFGGCLVRFYECECGKRFSIILSDTHESAIDKLCEMWAKHEIEYEDLEGEDMHE